MKKIIKAALRRCSIHGKSSEQTPLTLYPKGKPRGVVLYSYICESLLSSKEDPLMGHSNRWESREIANIFLDMGFVVDAIDWNNSHYSNRDRKEYLAVFDINTNLQRLKPLVSRNTKMLLHITGSYPRFNNDAEIKRVAEFEEKTGCYYSPKRLVSDIELWDRSLKIADSCSLIGNDYTINTFPPQYRDKISLVPVSASVILQSRTSATQATGKEFLWFFGGGLVHKGLDLVLEEFSRRPSQVLHIVGDIESEPDFCSASGHLLSLPNIIVHGRLDPAHPSFQEKLRNVFCFIAPSCAEGTSPAAMTCLQYGFFPILSAQTGVSLPNGSGIVLSDLSAGAIGKSIDAVCQMTDTEVRRQTNIVQRFALENHSRDSFHKTMEEYLLRCLL